MTQYVWELERWPEHHWDADRLLVPLALCRKRQGAFLAGAAALGFETSEFKDAQAEVLVEEVVQTAAIEGEVLDRESVRSSVAVRLGLPSGGLRPADKASDGLVQVLLDATLHHDAPLTAKRLKGWHAALFPTGYSGMYRIQAGQWRKGPVRVVSGPVGKEQLHYEGPPAASVNREMKTFLDWWKPSVGRMDGILRAGLAHFWFVTIHPFDDGNGRLARALTDMALAQDEAMRARFYSLSAQIMQERQDYYAVLERTQKGSGDVTGWLEWFVGGVDRAMTRSGGLLGRVLGKAEFWRRFGPVPLSERQRKVLNKLLDAGQEGFEGGLTNRKYVGMTKTTRATAQRDLADLVVKGMLHPKSGRGRSASYEIAWPGNRLAG
jgi:Fic family protein